MKSVAATILLCLLGGANAGAISTGGDHPIVRVINLIEGLKETAISEGKAEEVAYTKFQYWCSTSSAELKSAIADEKEKIDELEDKISGLTKEKTSLETEIETLEGQIGDLEASGKAAKDDRAAGARLYSDTSSDLESTIKAVGDCIKALSGAQGATEAKMMLAQHHVKMVLSLLGLKVNENQRHVLEAFAGKPDQLSAGDMDKHVDKYDFKSENVIELLKNLKMKFEDDSLAATKEETNAINSYQLAKSARDNSITAAKKSKDKKEKELATTNTGISDSKAALESTNDDLKDDSNSLSDTQDACRTKKGEWEARSETRKGEVEAMAMAVKILSKTTGVRTEAPGNPVPPPAPVLLQIRQVSNPKMKAVVLLKAAAKEANSRALDRLAVEVAAHLNGPFDQVNNMIEKMIFRLMDEQKKEDEHKHWCDQEIEKTETMQSDKTDKIAELKTEIDVQTATVSKLTDEITTANTMISDIVKFLKEATEIRQTGKKENALAIKDSQAAQTALTNAIAVLTDFYKSSGEVKKEPWEFIQEPVKLGEKPSTWDAGYTGVADPDSQPKGIIAVLEEVQSDFSHMEADTKAQEATDQKEYEESVKSNQIEKAGREQEVKSKEAEKARRADKIVSLSGTKKNVEAELEKTDQYAQDLKPACVDGDSSYGDRKSARTKEIDALKTAQITLEDAFKEQSGGKFLQIKRHSQ